MCVKQDRERHGKEICEWDVFQDTAVSSYTGEQGNTTTYEARMSRAFDSSIDVLNTKGSTAHNVDVPPECFHCSFKAVEFASKLLIRDPRPRSDSLARACPKRSTESGCDKKVNRQRETAHS